MSEAKRGGFFRRLLEPFLTYTGETSGIKAPILPYNIRFALGYGGGGVGQEHMRELVISGESALIPSAIYTVAKALESEPKKQGIFIEEIANTILESPTTVGEVLLETIDSLSPDVTVPAAKLAQFSRQGFDTWDRLFKNAAQVCKQEGETPVLVAHVMIAGLGHFLKETDSTILIINPRWIEDPLKFLCGYIMNREKGNIKVEPLFRDFKRPEVFTIIDDTLKTGSTIQRVWNFVTGSDIIDESRVKVLCRIGNS